MLSFAAIIVAITATVLLGRLLFGGSGGAQIAVPDLAGLTVQDATQQLSTAGLVLGNQTPENSERPPGTIIAQRPAAGDLLESGQSVDVTLSAGPQATTVPDLVGLVSIQQARIVLERAGLTLGAIKEKASSQPGGYVLDQDPPSGDQVAPGSAVDITIASGKVKVPNVVGLTEAQARSDLTQAGFLVQTVQQEDPSVDPGMVLAQSPVADTVLGRGTSVTITVSISGIAPSQLPTEAPPSVGPTQAPPEPVPVPVPSTAPSPATG